MSDSAIEITNLNFEEKVTNNEIPVLIDFWAEWCAPCKMIAPAIDEIAVEYKGKAVIGKVDIDSQVELAQKFGVMSIPTLLLFKNGEPVGKVVGVVGKDKIASMIDSAI
ncbi:MAG: thioredoxin [Clostridia bacterium]|mgnify:CR=1 FL=1|jgi:thioredoxin 1|nr:thioredoxin [Clostridia bacterium]MBT7123183.1 thioredoxin [Clostridia bacterium]